MTWVCGCDSETFCPVCDMDICHDCMRTHPCLTSSKNKMKKKVKKLKSYQVTSVPTNSINTEEIASVICRECHKAYSTEKTFRFYLMNANPDQNKFILCSACGIGRRDATEVVPYDHCFRTYEKFND